jgi:hypothetical protein
MVQQANFAARKFWQLLDRNFDPGENPPLISAAFSLVRKQFDLNSSFGLGGFAPAAFACAARTCFATFGSFDPLYRLVVW